MSRPLSNDSFHALNSHDQGSLLLHQYTRNYIFVQSSQGQVVAFRIGIGNRNSSARQAGLAGLLYLEG